MCIKGDAGGSLAALATDRLHSKGDGSTFFPYGETKSGATITGDSFATYSRDWTGLDYADQRWYSPAISRFTTSDPFMKSAKTKDSGSWNRFCYVRGNPVNRFDPMGLDDCPAGSQTCITVVGDPVDPVSTMSANGSRGFGAEGRDVPVPEESDGEGELWPDSGGEGGGTDWHSVSTASCTFWMAMAEECDNDRGTIAAVTFMFGARRGFYFGIGLRGIQQLYATSVGRMAERLMADLLNLKKNNGQFKLTNTLSRINRVPDFVDQQRRAIFEVKNVASISLTPQIRDMAAWASQQGWSFTLYVRRNAAGIGELRDAGINVVEMEFAHEE